MSLDILIALKDKDDNRSFQPTLWLSSAVEVDIVIALRNKDEKRSFQLYLSKLRV